MIRPQYDQVDEEDRQAHLGSRSDVLSKSFVTDLWMKVISRAVDDLVSIELLKKQNVILKEEDKEIEETATSFLFDDNHRIALDDYLVDIVCVSCQWHSTSPMSEFSGHESICPNCNDLIDPRVCDYEITEQQVYRDISLRELLSVWEIEDIVGFRNGVRERIKVLTEKKNTASLNRVRLKNERKERMENQKTQAVESNFEVVTEEQLTDFDKGVLRVLDDISKMLMAKNRK
jgi:hypothetical protein